MTICRRLVPGFLAAAALALTACAQAPAPMAATAAKPADSAPLKVLTAGAIKPVLLDLLAEFETTTGIKLLVQNDTAGGLVRRVQAGEAHDVLINTTQGFESLAKDKQPGQSSHGPLRNMAQVGIGIAVRAGAPAPRITNAEEFKAALLAAPKVAFTDPTSGGTSGIYLSNWFDSVGIGPAIRAKAVMSRGGLTAEFLVKGEADIAVQQMSELMAVPGVTIVGHLPADIQRTTTYAIAATPEGAGKPGVAALMRLLASAKGQAAIKSKGMQPLLAAGM